jgi:hypothetical protein
MKSAVSSPYAWFETSRESQPFRCLKSTFPEESAVESLALSHPGASLTLSP